MYKGRQVLDPEELNKLIFRMADLIKIAVDAMGGDGSPKNIDGIVQTL